MLVYNEMIKFFLLHNFEEGFVVNIVSALIQSSDFEKEETNKIVVLIIQNLREHNLIGLFFKC